MIFSKTPLQEKFNQLPNVGKGKVLQFNDNNVLTCVDYSIGGISPQIRVIAESGSIVSCTNGQITIDNVQEITGEHAGYWFFNLPVTGYWTINITMGQSTTNKIINVTERKQYTVNMYEYYGVVYVSFDRTHGSVRTYFRTPEGATWAWITNSEQENVEVRYLIYRKVIDSEDTFIYYFNNETPVVNVVMTKGTEVGSYEASYSSLSDGRYRFFIYVPDLNIINGAGGDF